MYSQHTLEKIPGKLSLFYGRYSSTGRGFGASEGCCFVWKSLKQLQVKNKLSECISGLQ